jgi:hypothetical protein
MSKYDSTRLFDVLPCPKSHLIEGIEIFSELYLNIKYIRT